MPATFRIVPAAALVLAAFALPAVAAAADKPTDCPLHGSGDVAAAEEHAAGHGAPAAASPYVDLQHRDIKAISEEETRQLLAGEGMSLALPAELHGYPGPKHVLELALSAQQRPEVEAAFQAMRHRAVTLGSAIVAAERDLDRRFAGGSIDLAALREITAELGRLRGELRAAHLAAHLEVTDLLTPEQRRRYAELRGYAGHQH